MRSTFPCAALALLMIAMFGGVVLGDPIVALDFGTMTSPVYDVYDKVSAHTAFDGKFGWTEPALFEERDRGGSNLLTRDFIFAREAAAFRIAVPKGVYRVNMICGDPSFRHPGFAFRVSKSPGYEVPAAEAGEYFEVAFDIDAHDGVIDIYFAPLANLWLVNALTVEPISVVEFSKPVVGLLGAEVWKPCVVALIAEDSIRKLKLVKKPDSDRAVYPDTGDYMRVLERFPLFAERGWHPNYEGLSDVGYFGDGTSAEMGLRSMGNFIFTCALLASDPSYDPRPTGVSQAQLLDYARQCLRYMTRAHATGDLTCADGKPWGNHWQSAWWAGKMAAGVHLIWDKLSPDERAAVERVVVHEANRHLDRKAPGGSRSNTRSEENGWDTEVMAWAFSLFPDHPNAARWWRKLQEFSMNTLSAPQDLEEDTLVDRRPVSSWVYTENIHPDFTIENHGAYHFCYMACPLHSLAWDWYALNACKRPVPQAIFHHFTDVWDVIRRTYVYDSRFAYLSGKDWPRYAYGMYFIMPALVMLQYEFGDQDARLIERQRFAKFEAEQIMNADGTFYGKRFTRNRMLSRPLEYETDTYANLGVCYLMHRRFDRDRQDRQGRFGIMGADRRSSYLTASDPQDFQRRVAGTKISKESGWAFSRSPKMFTSFGWRDLHGPSPIGLFIPADCDDMVEWGREQLAGSFSVEGDNPKLRKTEHLSKEFDGGFWTVGRRTFLQSEDKLLLAQDLAFVSLPEEGFAVLFDRAVAVSEITVNSHEGLKFHLANDVFNDGRRVVRSPRGEMVLWGGNNTGKTPPASRVREIPERWICVDGKLSFISLTDDVFTIKDQFGRTAPWNSIEYELISLPHSTEPETYRAGEAVRDTAVVLAAGDSRVAENISRSSRRVATGDTDIRSVVVSVNQRNWLITVNLGEKRVSARLKVGGRDMEMTLEPMSAEVKAL